MAGPVTSVFRPALFAGKSAIITGGGTGIGKAIAQELLYLGCEVMVASRNLERLQSSVVDMRSGIPKDSPARLEMMQCNIRKEDQVQNLVKETLSKFGKVDFLVNNAGGQFPSPADGISLKGFNAVVETNLTGTFLCCREVYNQWMQENGGVIINIIADMFKGFPGMSHTGAARAGVENLTKSLSIEWAPSGVRINAVAPGIIVTPSATEHYAKTSYNKKWLANQKRNPMKRGGTGQEGVITNKSALEHYKQYSQAKFGEDNFFEAVSRTLPFKRPGQPSEGSSIYSDTARANYEKIGANVFEYQIPRLPTKRLGTVEEISGAVAFLLSPASAFISGATLRVDGAHSLYTTSGIWEVPDHDNLPAYTWEKDVKEQEELMKKSKL